MHHDFAVIVLVDRDAVVLSSDLRLIEEARDVATERTTPLAGNDLHFGDALFHSLADHPMQLAIDGVRITEDVVKIKDELGHHISTYIITLL